MHQAGLPSYILLAEDSNNTIGTLPIDNKRVLDLPSSIRYGLDWSLFGDKNKMTRDSWSEADFHQFV